MVFIWTPSRVQTGSVTNMNRNDLVSIETIFEFLNRCEPLEPNVDPLEVFSLHGKPVHLHTDVNLNREYGLMWEWWLASEDDDWLTGGFEPAKSDAEVAQLAGIIHAACERIIEREG